jgi:hypothetical protein
VCATDDRDGMSYLRWSYLLYFYLYLKIYGQYHLRYDTTLLIHPVCGADAYRARLLLFSIFLLNIVIIVGNIGLKQVNIPIIVVYLPIYFNAFHREFHFNAFQLRWDENELLLGPPCIT